MAIRQQILIALLLVLGFCFYGLGEAKVEKKTVASARKEDVPFIKCSVCEAIAKQLVRQVKEKREKSAPKKVLTSFTCINSFSSNHSLWSSFVSLKHLPTITHCQEIEALDLSIVICSLSFTCHC